MEQSTRKTGGEGEEIAALYLQSAGWEIIERNYTYGKNGEIDIVAKDPEDGSLVFMEVKYRNTDTYGAPEDAITLDKQRRMRKMGRLYLFDKNIYDVPCRFDVITVSAEVPDEPVINHYKNIIFI